MGGGGDVTGELQRYEHGELTTTSPTYGVPSALDQWVLVVRDVSRLAAQIADTPFVPDGLRGNPAAVTAAILTGREMGLGPMTSLAHIHVIKGKPGKSAEIMRAMVQAAGHEIRDVESNDTRCVLEGRRHGEEQWTRVVFTADQAKKARIDLGGYPEDKLYARATTRLCRRKFADTVGGIAATIDELEDADLSDTVSGAVPPGPAPPVPVPPESAKRTARRRTPPATVKPVAGPTPDPVTPAAASPPPALPGDERQTDEHENPDADGESVNPAVTLDQLTMLHAQLGDLKITERGDKLAVVGQLVQRQLSSSSDLTRQEASQAIDTLAHVLDSDDPKQTLDAVLGELEG